MIHIVLVEPEIPHNTGNIARTCAAAGLQLHLVRPLGFVVDDKHLKRAGMDYWDQITVTYYNRLSEVESKFHNHQICYATTKGGLVYSDMPYQPDCVLIFGKESKGLPEELLKAHPERCIRIPMIADTRSLNLSNAAAIVAYEALRQQGFRELKTTP